MLSKKEIKFIKSLKYKKYQKLNNCFIVEGKKIIMEFIDSKYELNKLFYVGKPIPNISSQIKIDKSYLEKISLLKNPDNYLAIFKIKEPNKVDENNLIVALDSVRDPGNLGTIIRTCEWYGIKDIICSKDSVDCYNNKVVQSSMGSLSRMNISYLDLLNYIKSNNKTLIGTTLTGKSIYNNKIKLSNVVLLFGNESSGISEELLKVIDLNLSIPRFNTNKTPESLNLAASVAIVLSEAKKLTLMKS